MVILALSGSAMLLESRIDKAASSPTAPRVAESTGTLLVRTLDRE